MDVCGHTCFDEHLDARTPRLERLLPSTTAVRTRSSNPKNTIHEEGTEGWTRHHRFINFVRRFLLGSRM